MIIKSLAIVINSIKYSDTSLIVNLITQKRGRHSFIIKGAFTKKAKIKSNLFQPLFLLEVEMNFKENRNLQTINEAKLIQTLDLSDNQIKKNSIRFFLSEILNRSIKEHDIDDKLFQYISNSIELFNVSDYPDFHLCFLINLTKYLGFYPSNNFSESNQYFDLINARFVSIIPSHSYYLNQEYSKIFSQLLSITFSSNTLSVLSNRHTRFEILLKIIDYYKIHLDFQHEIKSIQVLKEVFD